MFSPSITSPLQSLSSLTSISLSNFPTSLPTNFSNLSLTSTSPPLIPPIRMGGGPRTFPGGVSKWQWKRMQAKKSKQLLKARLARERQIYEMRKRAELKASLSELERPWEVVEKAPTLFSVKADEQLKVLADRFQKPGGFDMWGEEDGPELFKREGDGKSARFFPKWVVHSFKPYGGIDGICDRLDGSKLGLDGEGEDGLIDWRSVMSEGGSGSDLREKRLVLDGSGSDLKAKSGENRLKGNMFKKRRERKWYSNGSEEVSSRDRLLGEGNGRRERNLYSDGLEEVSSREGVLDEGNGRRDFREVYDKREYRRVVNLNALEGRGSREVAFDEGNGRRNLREEYSKRDYRRQDGMNGSGEVAFNEGNGRRNPRQGYNENGYRRQNSSNGSERMSSREGGPDEENGRRNFREVYNKNGYRMQKSSNGSGRTSLREGRLDEGSGRKNIRQVYNNSGHRIRNSSEEVKGSTKEEVYDLRLERDGRYEFRPEN